MELKRAKVVMLPTEDKGALHSSKTHPELLQIGDHKVKNPYWQGQHLYFTTDDDIEEGDWLIFEDTVVKYGSIVKGALHHLEYAHGGGIFRHKDNLDDCKKIVATTDPKLTSSYKEWEECDTLEGNRMVKRKMKFPNKNRLPQPSQAFIEKYCKVGGIDEVMIECWDCHKAWMKLDPSNYIKIDSHNTITIHPIKDSWSREEVEELIINAVEESHDWSRENDDVHSIGIIRGRFLDNWLEQNLPDRLESSNQ